MRVLCLRFLEQPEPSWAEAFLKFTPLVSMSAGGLFLEISSTQHLFRGEANVMALASVLAERLSSQPVNAAIAFSAPAAQALAMHKPGTVVPLESSDAMALAELPLAALRDLEGLTLLPTTKIESVADFFRSVGVATLSQLQGFEKMSFHERWGELGTTLWKRLHGVDEQKISPWLTREPLSGYVYFEHPAGLLPILDSKLRPILETLFLRLEGQGRFARRLSITLHCEWSEQRHVLNIEPIAASRDLRLFVDLLWQKLEGLDLGNPVKEVEISIQDVPEQIQQLDFFEPRETGRARWERLISFAAQGDIEMGFLQPVAEHFAEESMVFKPAEPVSFDVKDVVEVQEQSVQVKPSYSKGLTKVPRPSLLLNPPRELEPQEASALRRLTEIPTERVSGPWWKPRRPVTRDYYYAYSPEGRLLWIFRDRATRKVYLQGAFD